MIIIGLTGGIASGKSAVAKEFAERGAVVLDADRAAHEILNLPDVQQALADRWGKDILTSRGDVDRAAIAKRVFSDQPKAEKELRFLEETLHPRIRKQFEAKLAELLKAGTQMAVIDAPLLLEAGWENLCDHLVFVDSPRAARLERAKLRNWSEAEFAKREALQLPIAKKRELSTHILDNSGSKESLKEQVHACWASLETQNGKTS